MEIFYLTLIHYLINIDATYKVGTSRAGKRDSFIIMAYFLVSLATRTHLDLCIDYSLAGFTNSINGAWTFSEIGEGDYISFLYGARAHNLYKVEKRIAYRNAQELPPWPPITFRSGRTYYFPFRLHLRPIRELDEPLVRAEFAYVAEDLLLRGGYARTHFQADQTTLQSVSDHIGKPWTGSHSVLALPDYETFEPAFTKNRNLKREPEIFPLKEFNLQSAIRQFLCKLNHLQEFLVLFGIETEAKHFEVLGEKALSEGHVDILIKESVPIGESKRILVEIKRAAGLQKDVEQIQNYVREVGNECIGGVLIASKFSEKVLKYAREKKISPITYTIALDFNDIVTFKQILECLQLTAATHN